MKQTLATKAWTDFAMRPNTTSPEGQVPTTGEIVGCPDIIPQASPVNDPQAVFSTPDSWKTTYPGQVLEGRPNYLYVRAKNFYPGQEEGTVRLYAAGSSLIQWPSIWLQNPLTLDSGSESLALSAQKQNDIIVGQQPFYWEAPPPPAGSDHYCLFSLVDTENTPNPLLHSNVPSTFGTMAELVTNSLNVGWKNVAEVANDIPTWTKRITLEVPAPVEQGSRLHIYCNGTGKTVGGSVALSSGESQGFDPVVNMPKTEIRGQYDTYGLLTTPSPGLARATINVSFWKGTSDPTLQDRISVYAGWVPPDPDAIGHLIEAGVARRVPEEAAGDEIPWDTPVGAMHYRFTG